MILKYLEHLIFNVTTRKDSCGSEGKNKLKLVLTCICLIVLFSCKSQKNKAIIPFIATYIDYSKNNPAINSKENILVVGSNKNTNEKDYWVYTYLVNPKFLSGFKYSNVYLLGGYKTIIDESLNTSFLESTFINLEKLPMEDLNLAKYPYNYNTNMWRIVFNNKDEVVLISPQEKSEEIKSLLEKKGVKFSEDY